MSKHSFQDRERIRRNAAYSVTLALVKGQINKPGRCEKCEAKAGRPRRITHWADLRGRSAAITELVAHHADYSRPLDVVWLCRPCHMLAELESGDVRYGSAVPLPRPEPRADEDHSLDLLDNCWRWNSGSKTTRRGSCVDERADG